MTRNELNRIIEALESLVALDVSAGRSPSDTVKAFCDGEGHGTAAYCIAAMVRRASWDGRISRYAKDWAASIELPEDWARRVDEIYSNRIHMAHLSQLAEAMAKV